MNVGTLLTKAAGTFPGNLAIGFGARRLTYAEFNQRANRLANALSELGLRRGDNVAVLQYNYPETLECFFACFKAGFGVVPINFRLHPNEYAFIIDHSDAKAVICSPEFDADILRVRTGLPKVKHLIGLSGSTDGLTSYEALLERASGAWEDAAVAPDDLAWLFYTSGTTGSPKGAMLTHRNLIAMTMNFYADVCPDLGPADVVLHAAPLSHGSGLYALPNIAKAAANIILDRKSFDAAFVLRSLEKYRVSNIFVAPTMLKLLVDRLAETRIDCSSLRAIVYGGGPMLVEDLKAAIRGFGPCLVQIYGQGESPMTISYLPQRDHVLDGEADAMRRLGSAGFARTDVEVRIVGAGGREAPAGEMGEITTRSDLVMRGYWNNPEATAAAIRDGWLYTGDVGYVDERGYLFLMDRSKDMIISGGENIYPREVEEVLIRHPAVEEVAVIGVPDAKWGEAVKAVVVTKPGARLESGELIAFCADAIAGYKKPKSVEFVAELPKNNYGKVLKREIRSAYWENRGREI